MQWLQRIALFTSTGIFSQPNAQKFAFAGYAQGTTYQIIYYADQQRISKTQVDSILAKIDSSLSVYKSYSLITQFNNSTNGVKMDEYLRTVVKKSIEIFHETGGIFDITVFPLVSAWGFGPVRINELPDSAEIKDLLPCVGSNNIKIEGEMLVKHAPCVKLDVNGIAQGYSVDLLANFMEKNGIQNYLVEIGGELRVNGRKQPGGDIMEIGIEGPANDTSGEPIIRKVVQLKAGALTTSGSYRKYFEKKQKLNAHLINPRTGYPFQNELIGVTVYAKDAITADAYDNAFMGMGLKKALAFVKKHRGIEAYFIYQDGNGKILETATPGFYKLMKVL